MDLVFLLFLLCAGVLFVWSMRKSRQDETAMRAGLEVLTRKGFNVDYLLRGNIRVAFDASRRQVAFIYANGTRLYDFSIIRDWQLIARRGGVLKNREYPSFHPERRQASGDKNQRLIGHRRKRLRAETGRVADTGMLVRHSRQRPLLIKQVRLASRHRLPATP